MFATVFNYTAFHKRYDDNYAGIAIPAFLFRLFLLLRFKQYLCS